MNRVIIIFFAIVSSLLGETLYVTQSGAGSADGSSLGNAWSMASLNTSGNWGAGAGKVSAGDTVILNGTITSTLTVQGSGSAGNPVTIQFADSSAKFSKAFWGTTTSAGIYATGKSYITIDGNFAGIIENTANGDALANQQQSHGIYTTGGTNIIVKNLTIRTIFIHTAGTSNPAGVAPYTTVGWQADDGAALEMHDCTISNAYTSALWKKTGAGTSTGFSVYNNTTSACSTSIVVAASAGTMDSIAVYKNDITMGANWYEVPNANHIDGIHLWGIGGSLSNTSIYSNYIHGDGSLHSTGHIFYEASFGTVLTYNNVLVGSTNKPAEGYINAAYNGAGGTTRIYNNRIVGLGTASSGGNGITIDPTNASMVVYLAGNSLSSLYTGYYEPTATSTLTADKNVYYNLGNTGIRGTTSANLAAWRTATGGEANSSSLTQNDSAPYYIPVATSSAIGTGQDNSAYFTTDISGATRSSWDIGAVNSTTSSWTVGATAGGDTTAPTVTITGPTSSTTDSTTAAAYTISGTASDNVAVSSVAVVMTGATTGSVTITGTTTWSGSTTLNAGATVFTATATDSSSNTGTDVLTTTYTVITPARQRRGSAPVSAAPGF